MISHSEHDAQVSLVRYFRLRYPKGIVFAIPNGGHRHPATAVKLKAEGVLKGIPDLCVIREDGEILWLEMKTEKGKLSPDQKTMIKAFIDRGMRVAVGYGFDDAKIKVDIFMEEI